MPILDWLSIRKLCSKFCSLPSRPPNAVPSRHDSTHLFSRPSLHSQPWCLSAHATASSNGKKRKELAADEDPRRSQEADLIILIQRLTTPLKVQLLPLRCSHPKGRKSSFKRLTSTCCQESPSFPPSLAVHRNGALEARPWHSGPSIHLASVGTACLINGPRDGWLQWKEKGETEGRKGGRERGRGGYIHT